MGLFSSIILPQSIKFGTQKKFAYGWRKFWRNRILNMFLGANACHISQQFGAIHSYLYGPISEMSLSNTQVGHFLGRKLNFLCYMYMYISIIFCAIHYFFGSYTWIKAWIEALMWPQLPIIWPNIFKIHSSDGIRLPICTSKVFKIHLSSFRGCFNMFPNIA